VPLFKPIHSSRELSEERQSCTWDLQCACLAPCRQCTMDSRSGGVWLLSQSRAAPSLSRRPQSAARKLERFSAKATNSTPGPRWQARRSRQRLVDSQLGTPRWPTRAALSATGAATVPTERDRLAGVWGAHASMRHRTRGQGAPPAASVGSPVIVRCLAPRELERNGRQSLRLRLRAEAQPSSTHEQGHTTQTHPASPLRSVPSLSPLAPFAQVSRWSPNTGRVRQVGQASLAFLGTCVM
jgi:hypothetical protein